MSEPLLAQDQSAHDALAGLLIGGTLERTVNGTWRFAQSAELDENEGIAESVVAALVRAGFVVLDPAGTVAAATDAGRAAFRRATEAMIADGIAWLSSANGVGSY
jgi:hypothetical protein